jgi:uncharacterized membrane protein
MNRIFGLLKANFFAGILVLIPFLVVGWIITGLIGALMSVQEFFPSWIVEQPALRWMVTASLLFAVGVTVSLVGWVSKQYIGEQIIEWIGEWIERIPVVRSIYGSLNQLLKTLGSGEKNQFSRVVYFEFPRAGCWTLGFVTGQAKGLETEGELLNIFIPTTPNPTSGFYLMVPSKEVRDSHLSVEEAFKRLLSLGVAQDP